MKFNTKSILKFLFFIFLSFYSQFLSAQYEDLQKDKNISWIAEFSNDYSFSLNTSDKEQNVKLIKFNGDASNFSDANHSNWIVNWIFKNVIEGHYNCYKDSELTQPLSPKNIEDLISNTDTVTTFNSDTYEEMIQIIKIQLSAKDIAGLKVKQVIYYNRKNKNFNTRIVALAPLVYEKKEEVSTPKSKSRKKMNPAKASTHPIFWIKMNGKLPKKFKVKSSDINWAALMFSKTNPVDLNNIKTVKTNYGFDIKNRLYQQAFNFEKPLTRSYESNDEINIKDLNSIYTSVDTVVTMDPATYQEVRKEVRKELQPNDISKIRLVQEWYFDKKRRRLMNRLKAICPTVKNENRRRRTSLWKSLYYIKYD